MTIIVSDLEGTLTTGSSWQGLRTYYKQNYNAWSYNAFFLKWIPVFPLVQLGFMSRREVMTKWMLGEISLFRGATTDEFNEIAEWIVEHVMWPKRRMSVLEEIDQHRQLGAKIAIVSSAYQPIVTAFAKRMDAIPIGSPLIFHKSKLVGVELPINSYEQKSKCIRDRLGERPISFAYGDTSSDIHMMEMSAEPIAVFPDKHLRQYAETRNWRILESTRS